MGPIPCHPEHHPLLTFVKSNLIFFFFLNYHPMFKCDPTLIAGHYLHVLRLWVLLPSYGHWESTLIIGME